jgi:hypothetical protein
VRLDVKRRWRLTFGGDRIGYLMEVIDYEKPKYPVVKPADPAQPPQPPTERTLKLRRQGADAAKPFLVTLRTRQWGYWGHDLCGNHYEDTVLAVSPAGEVSESGKMYNSSLFGPRDDGPIAPRRVFLWSLGRFFSKQLDTVTRVEKAADGRLLVSALGRTGDQQRGRWELEIEPAAAWMVRKARFYWDISPQRVSVEMKNEGTVWSGSRCIPREAVCNHWGPIDDPRAMEERLTFDPVVEPYDEKLYSDTQQAVAHNQTPTLTLHDYRVSPPVIVEPFRPKPTPTPPGPPSAFRKWAVLGSLVLIIGFCAFLVLSKRRRGNTEGSR